MAGAGKHRARKERRNGNGNANQSQESPPQNSPSTNTPPESSSPPARYDGGADPAARGPANPDDNGFGGVIAVKAHKNLDLGLMSSYIQQGISPPTNLPTRPKQLNPTGGRCRVRLNHFPVEHLPTKPIYQYDVTIGSGTEARGLVRTAWEANTVKERLGPGWIFDNNKIAYSLKDMGPTDVVIEVDLDVAKGQQPRPGRSNKTRVVVRKAKIVKMNALQGYLDGKGPWDNRCLEAITFLDHLLREWPSQRYTVQKRNFFQPGEKRTILGGGIEAMKGVYASMRPVSAGLNPLSGVLSINMDVANTIFWIAQPLHVVARMFLNVADFATMVVQLRPARDGRTSDDFEKLRKAIRRLKVDCEHRKEGEKDVYTIDKIIPKSARDQKIELKEEGKKSEWISIEQYFERKYRYRLDYPQLPVVKMTKGDSTFIPMELCNIQKNQRYPFRLTPGQTSEMIKFAVTLPQRRWQEIQNGRAMLDWGNDQYLANYGLKVLGNGSDPKVVDCKLLPPPKVAFGRGEATPGYSGRWDLKGKKFIEPAPITLVSWGCCIVVDPRGPGLDTAIAQHFLTEFIKVYELHGGKVQNKKPVIVRGSSGDAGNCAESLWNAAGNQSNRAPQILFYIAPTKNAQWYKRVKKSMDCRYGVVSQVLQQPLVIKCSPQYCSNVAMKVNAKLGGATQQAIGLMGPKGWMRPGGRTMYIGADVSHAAPGDDEKASIAAITVSFDKRGLKYRGLVESNGSRVEMITKANWESKFGELCSAWIKLNQGRAPEHVVYFRDGVSEGQYAQVLQQEVRDIKGVLQKQDPINGPKARFTVLTATKRHHVRFFPDKGFGDKNGNPQPGTLVETGCTAPYEYDFYLCAHSAIKGTARPVHYFVLLDEAKLEQPQIQNMIYEASYQYMRSTTPVSLHPAIYYAHLCAARGLSHYDEPSESSGKDKKTGSTPTANPTEIPPLLVMPHSERPERQKIRTTMWYI